MSNAEGRVNHVLSEYRKLAQKEYEIRIELFGMENHWEICKKYVTEMKGKWYKHRTDVVIENDKYKIL